MVNRKKKIGKLELKLDKCFITLSACFYLLICRSIKYSACIRRRITGSCQETVNLYSQNHITIAVLQWLGTGYFRKGIKYKCFSNLVYMYFFSIRIACILMTLLQSQQTLESRKVLVF